MRRLKQIVEPSMFQGSLRKRQYFEGWYFKLVDPSENFAYAIIPGVSLDKRNDTSHAFIQVIDARSHQAHYFKFDLAEFSAATDTFNIRIGKSIFSSGEMELHLNQDGQKIDGKITFNNPVRWPKRPLAPGIMGWYSYVPFMECYHGLVSMDHTLKGELVVDSNRLDFSGGKGYIEKDWGRSFPRGYVWMQSNHFSKEGISFMASIAKIPWLWGHFTGFLAPLWHNGRLYTFATYTGATIEKVRVESETVTVIILDKKYVLYVEAQKPEDGESQLPDSLKPDSTIWTPENGSMIIRGKESLQSKLRLRLFARNKDGALSDLIFEDTGRNAGLEIEASSSDFQK